MDQDTKLLPRDKLLRDTFTPAESLLFGLMLITANATFWLADPRSYWLLGFFLIAGAMTPVLLRTHQLTHPFFVASLWKRFFLYSSPVWLFLIQFTVGLIQEPLALITVNGAEFIKFEIPQNPWLPASTAAGSAWPVAFGFCAIYLVTIGLFLVPKSRAFFENLLPYLCLSSVLVALFGYIQKGLNASKPLGTKGTGADDFFGFFPYDGHWAAFAILWTCACISMALLATRYDDSPAFIESSGPWYLTGGILLGASAFMVDAKWPAVFLILSCAMMMMIFAAHFLASKRDPHRIAIATFSGLVSTGMFASGLFRIFQNNPTPVINENLRQSAWEMFLDRPIFGWGMDSFGHIMPYYASDLLLGDHYERAGSDALQILAEIGLVGVIPSVILIIVLMVRYLRGRHNMGLSNHMMIGLGAILGLAFLDSPFMSPAVFFSFLVLLFVTLRWADVTRNKVDEVDAPRPSLVTPHSLRRVPFHMSHKNDKMR